MAITKLQPFNLDTTANYTFANIATDNANLGNTATANFFIGSGNNLSNIQGANVTGAISTATTSGTVTTAAQPNITSTGSLTGLTVSNATGIVDFTTSANVTLGAVANLHISGGTAGYNLKTDGLGNLSWGVDSAIAGGSNTQIQFNDDLALNGNSGFTFDKTTGAFAVPGTGTLTGLAVSNASGLVNFTGTGISKNETEL